MQPDSPASLAMALPRPSARRPWPFHATLLGGVLLAAGLLLPLVRFALYAAGLLPPYSSLAEIEAWNVSADVLQGAGFLSGFLGIAVALRTPRAVPRVAAAREFVAVVVGGILVAAGIIVTTVAAGYVFVTGPGSTLVVFVDIGEVGGRILEAAGFLLVFAGIARTLPPRF